MMSKSDSRLNNTNKFPGLVAIWFYGSAQCIAQNRLKYMHNYMLNDGCYHPLFKIIS